MEYQEVMLEDLYQYMVEHGLVAVRLDGFTLYTEKIKKLRMCRKDVKMEITVGYSSVTQVEYKFNEWEVQRALIELIKQEKPDKLLKGGFWTYEWWDKEGR